MAKEYKSQKVVKSNSGKGSYIISENFDGSYECGCRGWTGHYPRTNCTHIREVLAGGGQPFGEAMIDALA